MAGQSQPCAPGERRGGKEIDELVSSVAADLKHRPVALGFECPLWLPLPSESKKLGMSRANEGRHSWSAGAGAAVLATGLVQIPWILERLKSGAHNLSAFLDWKRFQEAGQGLFLWEAFISGAGKKGKGASLPEDKDVRDAVIGAELFAEESQHQWIASGVMPGEGVDVTSMIGAALLRTAWSKDLSLLQQHCVVIKAAAQ